LTNDVVTAGTRGVVGVPDGASPETEASDESAQDAPPPDDQENEPPPADQQVDAEIMTAEAREWLGGIFGFGTPSEHESGGGGAGGEFMFANIEDLDAVITKWHTQRGEVQEDQDRIVAAYREIAEPAGDEMSRGQANAARNSLVSMWEHNSQMLQYTDSYIEKLNLARGDMVTMDQDAETAMKTTYEV